MCLSATPPRIASWPSQIYLFNLYTYIIFGAINTNIGIYIGGTTINILRYDGDTVLSAEKEIFLQETLNEVNCNGKTFDVKMNANRLRLC